MNGSRFDSLQRLASEVSTRRIALKSALAGAAASGIAAVGLASSSGETEAKKKKKKCKKCKPRGLGEACTTNKQCCTNETNRACAVAANAGNDDLTCCGGTGASCSSLDDCCADYNCDSGTCEPAPAP